jgi:hypothetical protein
MREQDRRAGLHLLQRGDGGSWMTRSVKRTLGLCEHCRAAAVTAQHCQVHREIRNEQARARTRRCRERIREQKRRSEATRCRTAHAQGKCIACGSGNASRFLRCLRCRLVQAAANIEARRTAIRANALDNPFMAEDARLVLINMATCRAGGRQREGA